MSTRSSGAIRRQLGTLFNLGAIGDLTDGQLLERFATRRGEAAELAFAALVERHGPMVLRVCRSTLRDPNDVQDAFQATFLVLVQKSRSLWVRDSLGPWLHRVAHRTATRARSSEVRRRKHEQQAAATRPTLVSEPAGWDDMLALLHAEIDRLPERSRVPLVLCDLQGLTHEKAARHLGWPVGTVKSRLARARQLLRDRLSRRGQAMPAGLMIAQIGPGGACKAIEVMCGTLVESTVQAAASFAAGKAVGVGLISTRVAILIEEVLHTMFFTKLKLATALVLFLGAVGAAGVLAQQRVGSAGSPTVDPSQEPGSAGSRQASRVDPAAPVPAFIKQSRAMILARLEEEVAEARARLNRLQRTVQSPDDPAVDLARKTFEDLQQRLDRIDLVLLDVVERYPTMVDFSGGRGDIPSRFQGGVGFPQQTEDAGNQVGARLRDNADAARANDRADWTKRVYDKGYIYRSEPDSARANSQKENAPRSHGSPNPNGAQKGGQQGENPGLQQGRNGEWPAKDGSGQKAQGYPQQSQGGQGPASRGSAQKQNAYPQPNQGGQ